MMGVIFAWSFESSFGLKKDKELTKTINVETCLIQKSW
jgi:hypothetical protein